MKIDKSILDRLITIALESDKLEELNNSGLLDDSRLAIAKITVPDNFK